MLVLYKIRLIGDMSVSKWIAIVNPNAGKGTVVKKWPVISDILTKNKISFEAVFTTHRYHAVELTIDALKSGFRNIISVGGDGTLHEIVNGIFHQTEVPVHEITVAVIPAGSGNDWVKMYGISQNYEKAVKCIVEGKTLMQDLGRVSYTESGVVNTRYMVNIAGIGFDGNICRYITLFRNNGKGGSGIYTKAAVNALLGRRFNKVKVKADGKLFFSGKMFTIGFGIGKYSAGGMIQFPDAVADDGLINIMTARKIPKLKFVFIYRQLFTGEIYRIKQVMHTIAKKFEIHTERPDRVEIDGELVGTTPMSVEVVPRALRVIVGSSMQNAI